MKKFTVIMVSLLLGLVVLSGCAMLDQGGIGGPSGPGGDRPAEKTELEIVAEKYAKISDAATVSQKIGITAESGVLQFESQKTYKKAGAGYQVTGSEKRLNPLSSGKAEPYTETSIEEIVKAGAFTPQLELDELYFTNSAVKNGTLEATVLDGSVETVLGLAEDLPAAVHDMTLKIVTDAAHVTSIDILYTSGTSNVTIALTFTY